MKRCAGDGQRGAAGRGAMTITEFLLARIAEDEALARECLPRDKDHAGGRKDGPVWGHWKSVDPDDGTPRAGRVGHVATRGITIVAWPDHTDHIARHDPARVLAECGAKRRIVEDYGFRESGRDSLSIFGERILGLLALPYADHPDYDEAWA